MLQVDELLEECAVLHVHMCPGQLLGVRMALLGCKLVGISDPKGRERKSLIVWVEIDRCMTDAISAVTGVRLGKRTLKFLDYGKVAATFFNTLSGQAVRIVALDSSRELANERYGDIPSKKDRQLKTYRGATDSELFRTEQVTVFYPENDAPGRPISRVNCDRCGEGINDGREVDSPDGLKLCRPCASGGYYSALDVDVRR